MLGLWFNHGDDYARRKQHEPWEFLKRFGFTDFYMLVKGTRADMRETPEGQARLETMFRQAREMSVRTHGVFICSEAASRLRAHPEEADILRTGARSDCRVSHVSRSYQQWLLQSIRTAVKEFSLDGVQLDFLRYGYIGNGWSPEEEAIYAAHGVDVAAIKQEIDALYKPDAPTRSLAPLFARLQAGDGTMKALVAARRKVIRDFLKNISEGIRREFPHVELSVAMMPEGLDPEGRDVSDLFYGQRYQDFLPLADHLFPMTYTVVFGKGPDWIGTIGRNAEASVPGAVMGLECTEPSTAAHLRDDLRALSGLRLDGVCLFRYGRLVFAVRDGEDTLLYNSYAGEVNRLILSREGTEEEMDCSLEEASVLRIRGHWDLIRAFGRFCSSPEKDYEGELCVVGSWMLEEYPDTVSSPAPSLKS